ncbi:MAG TPA: phosphatase, partial [Candidatus Acutalibacter ornithocaccae]|nr:phosphatase [Candidatus Acutalibacter ornithocaccae]
MNKKSALRAAAVIEIGSNNVRMRVSQWAKGTVATLDRLEYPVSLGHDVFSSGDISFDSLRELSSVLSKFTAALRSYNIEKPKVISCTALREAKNRALVVDQLKVRNGLEVTVLEDSQEKAYIYKEVMERLDGAKLHQGNTMIAYVGSGSIGVAVYDGQKIIYTQNISMGALKLH